MSTVASMPLSLPDRNRASREPRFRSAVARTRSLRSATMPVCRGAGESDEWTAGVRSGLLLGAVSPSSQLLATQIPNRLAERLRVGNLPSG